jgi:hypothetical protein
VSPSWEPAGAYPAGAQPAPPAYGAQGPSGPGTGGVEDASLGELFGRLTADLSTLMRQEVTLAKAEIKQEAAKAGKGAGLLGGTGLAALFGLTMLSFAAAWGLAVVIPTGFAFLVVGALYLAVAAGMFVLGRQQLRSAHPVPEQTVETLKEDAQWVKHPRS